MSYAACVAALKSAYSAGLTGVRQVLDHEPAAVQIYPTLYLLFDSSRVTAAGQRSARRWRVLARLVVARQDVRQDEPTVAPLVDALISVVEDDPTLGGAISSGLAGVAEQRGVFVEIGGVVYRAIDTYVEIVEKVAYGA